MNDIFPIYTKGTRAHNFILRTLFVNCTLNYFLNLLIYKFFNLMDCLYITCKYIMSFTSAHFNEIEQN